MGALIGQKPMVCGTCKPIVGLNKQLIALNTGLPA